MATASTGKSELKAENRHDAPHGLVDHVLRLLSRPHIGDLAIVASIPPTGGRGVD
eukprot:CAMPEP_0113827158 /NCGR_PEP_ID=MMETSP0328-20130328/4625_1 /TAXON_ID=39455 /ORGANISM="Alexandrium minutum" /LENGTH=54 /DNA_ID=CAMNT_0000795143 /DNA_START=62 /DNA_END=223 /DNA_ORIENTATION=+ /assembly_acc=CAM_ASM_000350